MEEINKYIREKIKKIAEKAVKCSVGESILWYGYEVKIPKAVENWISENKQKRIAG